MILFSTTSWISSTVIARSRASQTPATSLAMRRIRSSESALTGSTVFEAARIAFSIFVMSKSFSSPLRLMILNCLISFPRSFSFRIFLVFPNQQHPIVVRLSIIH